jgi:hypothetical protein
MKNLFFALTLLFSLSGMAEQFAAQKDQAMSLIVDLPEIFGPDISGKVLILHDINFSRVKDNEPFQRIEKFIYAEGNKEMDSFDPADGEGVIIAKEQLKGFLDTDLLKVKFDMPFYDKAKNTDNYPLALKFRASMLQRIFKKARLLLVRNNAEKALWKVYYNSVLEVDGLSIKLNGLGQVLKLDLLLKGKVVKSLSLSEIETIPEREF